jgi:protein phosphatase
MDKDHLWHMAELSRLAAAGGPMIVATEHRLVNLDGAAADWWSALTEAGGEGMVEKPRDFIVRGKKGFVQPGIKCRRREYLRIVYGLEYDAPENLERLRSRGLGKKRSFALGHEALRRFIGRAFLRRVHEAVFAILALESEQRNLRL